MKTLPLTKFLQGSLLTFLLVGLLVFLTSLFAQFAGQRSQAAAPQNPCSSIVGTWRSPRSPDAYWRIMRAGPSAQSVYSVPGQLRRRLKGNVTGTTWSGTWYEESYDSGAQSGTFTANLADRRIKVTFYVGNSLFDTAEWVCESTATPTPPPRHTTTATPTPLPTATPLATATPVPSPNWMSITADHDNDDFQLFDSLDPVEQKKVLIFRGPRSPVAYTASDLSMRVLVKGGWPIILEYGLVADDPAIMSIQIADRKPFLVRLDPSPRNQVNLHVPRIGSDEIHVAKVRIEAAKDTDEFRLYGFGMGEKALAAFRRFNADLSRFVLAMNNSGPGSATAPHVLSLLTPQTGTSIRIDVSLPSSLRAKQRPEQKIQFSFTSSSDFSGGRWEWWRVHGLDWKKVWNEKTGGISRNQIKSNDWNGIITSAKLVSPGYHALNLVAWQKAGQELEWVTARTDAALEVIE